MADFRNHRHHGLVGALVVLPAGATPHPVADGATTAAAGAAEAWHGARVTVSVAGGGVEEHMVLLMQDGLRLFLRGPNGEVGFALPDPPQEPAGDGEKEDQGSKAFNYRTEPRGPVFDPKGSPYTLAKADPATPVWHVDANEQVRFHLVGACDKPRQYSFTIHGVAWPEHRFQTGGGGGTNVELLVSSESAISCGSVRTLEFAPAHAGDHAFRSGVLNWAVPQGMWGLLRVH